MPEVEPILEIEAGDSGNLTLFDIDRAEEWVTSEQEAWTWLQDHTKYGPVQNAHNTIQSQLNRVANHIQQAKREEGAGTTLQRLQEEVDEAYQRHNLILAVSPRGELLKDLVAQGNGVVAAHAAAFWLSVNFQPTDPPAFTGAARAALFDLGIEAADPEKASLRGMRASWEKVFEDQRSDWETNLAEENDKLDQLKQEARDYRSGLQELLAKQVVDVGDQMEDAHDKLRAIETTYDQKLALQKPVEYWNDQANFHKVRSAVFGGLAAVSGFGVATGVTLMLKEILAQSPDPEYWEIGSLAVIVLLALWALRILVRIFLSHFHLKTDAAERAVMVNVYL
ncbi:MAG: DUF6161 domain-containing protein, partial [Chloroflexota bacterium]